jgi:threonine synthase
VSPAATRAAFDWHLACSACPETRTADGLATTCPTCGKPWLVRYERRVLPAARERLASRPPTMWRYREWLPLREREQPISLGEGCTPLLAAPRLAARLGVSYLWVKDEAANPTGSFKARGLSAAITRALEAGAERFVLPTAGNAGVAAAAYAARAGVPVRVYAPDTTPAPLLGRIRAYGADLVTTAGHIGDSGRLARACAAETGAVDLSTLREPYRIEGKKTLGLELAEQFGWQLPDVIVYPTGGGTGLIGMWKAFCELRSAGWVHDPLPRLVTVQSSGCAPVVHAFETGAADTEPWPDPRTVAAGLRVPGPLGGALMLRALRESHGGAIAVEDDALIRGAALLATLEGVDACPEGGAAVEAVHRLVERGIIGREDRIVLFNTGAGVLYGRDFT